MAPAEEHETRSALLPKLMSGEVESCVVKSAVYCDEMADRNEAVGAEEV